MRPRFLVLVLFLLGAVALAGCSSGEDGTPMPVTPSITITDAAEPIPELDSKFLERITDRQLRASDQYRQAQLGRQACINLDDGWTKSELIKGIQDSALTYEQVLQILSAAIAVYCPQHG